MAKKRETAATRARAPEPGPERDETDTPADAEAEADAPARTDRLARIAFFVGVGLTFGTGHFYARRAVAGRWLLATELAALGLSFAWPAFFYAIPLIVLCDVVGSVRTIRADQRGTAPGLLVRAAPVFALLGVLAIPGVRVAAPGALAGPQRVAACTRAHECGSDESIEACVARAADEVFAGQGDAARAAACAVCLDESLCEDLHYDDCLECAGLVQLPTPTTPVEPPSGPLGTSPDDLQMVVPTLFRTDEPQGMPEEDLDALLRSLEQAPPPMPGPPEPARPE